MTVVVELEGRHYEVELVWARVASPPGGYAWWLKSIDGQPRPRRQDVPPIYGRALELAAHAMRRDRGDS